MLRVDAFQRIESWVSIVRVEKKSRYKASDISWSAEFSKSHLNSAHIFMIQSVLSQCFIK